MTLQTVYDFVLPKGYVDGGGTLHRNGKMRMATAADEIYPLRDPRVQRNPEYLSVMILARVVTALGTLPSIDEKVIENLFLSDMAYLQDLYHRINQMELPSQRKNPDILPGSTTDQDERN